MFYAHCITATGVSGIGRYAALLLPAPQDTIIIGRRCYSCTQGIHQYPKQALLQKECLEQCDTMGRRSDAVPGQMTGVDAGHTFCVCRKGQMCYSVHSHA